MKYCDLMSLFGYVHALISGVENCTVNCNAFCSSSGQLLCCWSDLYGPYFSKQTAKCRSWLVGHRCTSQHFFLNPKLSQVSFSLSFLNLFCHWHWMQTFSVSSWKVLHPWCLSILKVMQMEDCVEHHSALLWMILLAVVCRNHHQTLQLT